MLRRGAAGALACLLLTACPSGADDDDVEPPRRGGVLRAVLAGDVDSLDPHHAASPVSWWFARALHRGLLAFPNEAGAAGGQPVPDLAELPTMTDDGRTYTFRLREGARFGAPVDRPLRAEDVRASLERLIVGGTGIARFLRVVRGSGGSRVQGITAPDERTVRIELSSPATDIPWVLAHPQAAVIAPGVAARGVPAITITGLGPYRLAAYEPEERIELRRNPAWRDDGVRGAHVDRIEAVVTGTSTDAVARIADGEADVLVDPGPPDVEQPDLPDTVRTERAPATCTRYLFLDRSVAPFGSRTVRRAIAHAVERVPVAAVTGDQPAPRLLPPVVTGSHGDAVLAEDIGRAGMLLAGRTTTVTLVTGDGSRDRAQSRALQRSIERLGLRVRIQEVPAATLYRRFRSGDRVAMGLATWCADWPGLAGRNVIGTIANPSAGRHQGTYGGIRSGALERALDAAVRARPEAAAGAWSEADRVAVGTGSVIPLVWTRETTVLGQGLGGWTGAPMWPRGDPTGLWRR